MINKTTAEKLEKLKKQELTSPDYYVNNIDFLMEMLNFIDYEKNNLKTTGLIEYQKFIKKYLNAK